MDILRRRERHKANKENARQKAREFIAAYLADHHCVDCGETDTIVLTFDHVRGKKRYNIADMVSHGLGIETIRAEIEKTEVRCFNCHAIRTHERQDSNRWKRVNANGG
jgi:hypothetical protein